MTGHQGSACALLTLVAVYDIDWIQPFCRAFEALNAITNTV